MEIFDRMIEKFHKAGPDKPIDITQAIRQVMDRQAIPMSRGRTVAPDQFQVFLTPRTDAAFTEWGKEALLSEFTRNAQSYAQEQNYSLVGSVQIELLVAPEGTRKTEVKAHSMQNVAPLETPAQSVPGGQNIPEHSVLNGQNWTPNFPPVSSADPGVSPSSGSSSEAALLQENADKPLLEVVGGQTYLLVGDLTIVGRGEVADVSLQDTSVSHRHFEMARQDQFYILHDLGSTSGTYVEGHKVHEATLMHGNTITIGQNKLVFIYPTGAKGQG